MNTVFRHRIPILRQEKQALNHNLRLRLIGSQMHSPLLWSCHPRSRDPQDEFDRHERPPPSIARFPAVLQPVIKESRAGMEQTPARRQRPMDHARAARRQDLPWS